MSNTPKPLEIQGRVVGQGITLTVTEEGKCINEELIAQEKKHKEEVESLKKERQEAIKSKDDGMNQILAAEQAKGRKKLEEAVAEKKLLAGLNAAEIKKREEEERKARKGRGEEALCSVTSGMNSGILSVNVLLSGDQNHPSRPVLPLISEIIPRKQPLAFIRCFVALRVHCRAGI